MIKLENHLGVIEISEDYFVNLVGNAVVKFASALRQCPTLLRNKP